MMPDRTTPEDDAWRSWPLELREREYSPSSAIGGDYAPYVAEWGWLSASARAALPHRLDLRYGSGSDERFDLFGVPGGDASGRGAPLLVFLHGGYWQEGVKEDSHYPAPGLVADGIAYASVEYTLCPGTTVAAIADQAVRAVDHLRREAPALGIDPARIVVAGHSAGGHLAAWVGLEAAATGRAADGATPLPPLAGIVPVSGVFELEPLIGTSIETALRLDVAAAQAISPQLRLDGLGGPVGAAVALPPAVVAWGEREPSEFGRQSRRFATSWAAQGGTAEAFEVPVRNHFDIVLDLGDGSTRLGAAVRRLLGGNRTGPAGV